MTVPTVLAAPRIHVQHMRTAGWRVVYCSPRGERVILHRRLTETEARTAGLAAARVHDCGVEVDR